MKFRTIFFLISVLSCVSQAAFANFGTPKELAQARQCLKIYNTKTPMRHFCCSSSYKPHAGRCFVYPVAYSAKETLEDNGSYNAFYDIIGKGPTALTTVCKMGPHDFRQVIIPCKQLEKNPTQYTRKKIAEMMPKSPQAAKCLRVFNTQAPARATCCSTEHDVFGMCGHFPSTFQTDFPEYDSLAKGLQGPTSYKKGLWLETICQTVDSGEKKPNDYVARLEVFNCKDMIKNPKNFSIYWGDAQQTNDRGAPP